MASFVLTDTIVGTRIVNRRQSEFVYLEFGIIGDGGVDTIEEGFGGVVQDGAVRQRRLRFDLPFDELIVHRYSYYIMNYHELVVVWPLSDVCTLSFRFTKEPLCCQPHPSSNESMDGIESTEHSIISHMPISYLSLNKECILRVHIQCRCARNLIRRNNRCMHEASTNISI